MFKIHLSMFSNTLLYMVYVCWPWDTDFLEMYFSATHFCQRRFIYMYVVYKMYYTCMLALGDAVIT